MSSGHASHKGSGIKQSHDTRQLDSAATTPAVNPEELLEEGQGYPFNPQGNAPDANISGTDASAADSDAMNLAAIERPE